MALLDAAQTHAAAAEKAGRAYDRTDPPTGMAAHEYYDKALRAAIDGPLGKVHPAQSCNRTSYESSMNKGCPVAPSDDVMRNQQVLCVLLTIKHLSP